MDNIIIALLHMQKRKNERGTNKETIMLNVDTFVNKNGRSKMIKNESSD